MMTNGSDRDRPTLEAFFHLLVCVERQRYHEWVDREPDDSRPVFAADLLDFNQAARSRGGGTDRPTAAPLSSRQ